jgi:carbonic anhydrase
MLRCAVLIAAVLVLGAAHAATYSYDASAATGPSNWATIGTSNTVCRDGGQQSPIDFEPTVVVENPILRPLDLASGYNRPTTIGVVLDGAQLEITTDDTPTDGATRTTMADPNGAAGDTYVLEKLQLHVVSEHTHMGSHWDLEIQLHFGLQTATAAAGAPGHIVVSVMALASLVGHNAQLGKIFNDTGIVARSIAQPASAAAFDATQLLPPVRDYHWYDGSLTSPPCTEGYRYYVMTDVVTVSAVQFAAIRAVLPQPSALTVTENAAKVVAAAFGNYRPTVANAAARQVERFRDVGAFGDLQIPSTGTGVSSQAVAMSIAALCVTAVALVLFALAVRGVWLLQHHAAAASGDGVVARNNKYKKLQ